jgi:sulfite reductase (ferredoxin)
MAEWLGKGLQSLLQRFESAWDLRAQKQPPVKANKHMQSFRTELENPLVEKDIIDLERKIRAFREGKIHEEKFRSLRLARGVYGQRQQGVQMVRIKLPFGKVSVKQLLRISDISDEYSTGNLHLTTRQDIQIHFVSLDRTPELWAKLELDEITLREACGNTVRNVTASSTAGIDPNEPFDVSPYAHAIFSYFLRKPFCQELGRKIKIAFSSSDEDTAFTFMHDLGFIPKIKVIDGKEVKGFRLMIGGGLGAQPFLAQLAYEFIEEDQVIPFSEAILRVFDRHGERSNRNKARFKYLLNKLGLPEIKRLVEAEHKALLNKTYIVKDTLPVFEPKPAVNYGAVDLSNDGHYDVWLKTNVFEQKQKGYYGAYVKITLGNILSDKARALAKVVEQFADANDIRITVNQGFLLKYITKEALPHLYVALKEIGLSETGFNSTAYVTACPGTDTCNLAISSSTGITVALESVIRDEYPDFIYNNEIKIKISGCMNACGQHSMAQIGFHGSSFKVGTTIVPALQVLLGGGVTGNGGGRVSDKVIKVASKRGPAVLRILLNDYESNATEGEYFNSYYDRKGKDYFYQLLKPQGDNTTLTPQDYIDWGQTDRFETAIGVGECAGVVIDLVATLLFETDEKNEWAVEALANNAYGDSIYYTYATLISGAKALLLSKQVHCNTQTGIIADFDKNFVATGAIAIEGTFADLVLQINKEEPSKLFAETYLKKAADFVTKIKAYRATQSEAQMKPIDIQPGLAEG